MNRQCRYGVLLAGLVLLSGATGAYADPPPVNKAESEKIVLPTPAEVKAMTAYPAAVRLRGSDDATNLIVTGTLQDGRVQDFSGDAAFEVADAKIVRVSSTGRVTPIGNGKTTITARYGNVTAQIPVETTEADVDLPLNFGTHVVPIFSKLGCNSGGCHGKSGGQNGFGLSLFGFDADMDYTALVKENRGRRVLPTAPDYSVLLLKATGTMAHAGGKRMEIGSDEYKIVRRWIASGLPYGNPTDPTVTKITVYPEHRIIARNNRQQIAVYAHYTDGSVLDVTQRAQYESNDQDIAVVDGTGLVRSLESSGVAAVMARYQGQVGVFRAMVPLGTKVPDYKFEPKTLVDVHTNNQWKQLGIVPSADSSDEIFIRRAYLDITASLPTAEKVREFLDSKDAQKREKLVDHLLDTAEYSYFFANKWADILRVKRGNNANRAYSTFAFHNWIRQSLAMDKPYDQFVREILAAIGDDNKNPPVAWYNDLTKPQEFSDDTAQLFLGTRMACAQCHHHPYEKWSQDDYWGMAAFFGRVGRKNQVVPGRVGQNNQNTRLVIFNAAKNPTPVINLRTKKQADIKPLDGAAYDLGPNDDPRHKLVDWMVDGKNPFFARAIVNRYWAHFFGRGLVDPLDDMRVTNPPSNPELLDALAKDFVAHKFSLKHLIRVMVNSRTYQLSAVPNEHNKHDKRSYARYYPRRMSAEVIFDAVCLVTDSPANFQGLPTDRHSPNRAIMLPDESFKSYFLDVFGRPGRISACECERVSEANLAQALHMLNSNEIQGKLTRVGGRADKLAKDQRPDRQKLEELFLLTFARRPSEAQLQASLEFIQANATNKKRAYEDIIWALINSKEFIFVQ